MSVFKIETLNPYFRNRRLPVALLHFTAGFLLLNAFLEGIVLHDKGFLTYLFLAFGVFELVYAFFSGKLLHRYPLLNAITRLLAAILFLLYAIRSLRLNHTIMGIFMILIACAFVMIYFIERKWGAPFIIEVNDRGVVFPRLFKTQQLSWRQFNRIILHKDILTLDFKNNKVLQLEVKGEYNESVQQSFNNFTRTQISQ